MKIEVKKSWLPWGKPSVKVYLGEYPEHIYIIGAKDKVITKTILFTNSSTWLPPAKYKISNITNEKTN